MRFTKSVAYSSCFYQTTLRINVNRSPICDSAQTMTKRSSRRRAHPSFMMTSWHGNIFRVTSPMCGEFTGDRWILRTKLVTRSFDVIFDLRLNKQLSKQWWGWWFDTTSRPWWSYVKIFCNCIVNMVNNRSFPCWSVTLIDWLHYVVVYATKVFTSNIPWHHWSNPGEYKYLSSANISKTTQHERFA